MFKFPIFGVDFYIMMALLLAIAICMTTGVMRIVARLKSSSRIKSFQFQITHLENEAKKRLNLALNKWWVEVGLADRLYRTGDAWQTAGDVAAHINVQPLEAEIFNKLWAELPPFARSELDRVYNLHLQEIERAVKKLESCKPGLNVSVMHSYFAPSSNGKTTN